MRYTAAEIIKRYGIGKTTVYKRFKRDDFQKYITTNVDGIKSISREGLDELLRELGRTAGEQQGTTEGVPGTVPEAHEEQPGNEKELMRELIEELKRTVEVKEREIEKLHELLEKSMKLNENNQILLLEKQKQPLLERIFGKRKD